MGGGERRKKTAEKSSNLPFPLQRERVLRQRQRRQQRQEQLRRQPFPTFFCCMISFSFFFFSTSCVGFAMPTPTGMTSTGVLVRIALLLSFILPFFLFPPLLSPSLCPRTGQQVPAVDERPAQVDWCGFLQQNEQDRHGRGGAPSLRAARGCAGEAVIQVYGP